MTPNEQELRDLNRATHEWLNSLIVSGVNHRAAVSAVTMAAIEHALGAGGVQATSRWLRNLADMVDVSAQTLIDTPPD